MEITNMWFNLTTAQWLGRCGYFRYTSGIFFFTSKWAKVVMCTVLNIVRQILSNLKRAFEVFSKKEQDQCTLFTMWLLCNFYWHVTKNFVVFIQVIQMRRREDGIPRLVINVDHRDRHQDSSSTRIIVLLLVLFRYVLVNPLAATPLFSPSSLARAALFGLVVFMPRGRTVAPAQNSP